MGIHDLPSLRKKIREQNKSLALFDIILQNIDYAITVYDQAGNISYENDRAEKMRLRSVKYNFQLLNKDGVAQKDSDLPYRLALRDHMTHNETLELKSRQKTDEAWYRVRAVPVFNKKSKLVYVLSTLRSVTDVIQENRRREHFIAIGSHELKTPLAGIKVLSQVMHKLYLEQKYKTVLPFFQKIDTKVNSLTKIIQDFIEVEKIRGDKLEFSPEVFDVDALVDDLIHELNSIYKSHRINKMGSAKIKIVADKERVSEVLMNLIGNAVKYSPGSDEIDVIVAADKHKITIGVRDYGIGLSSEYLENIFEPFYRIKDPENEKVHGLGLGLYISYKVIELHGGRMWAKSRVGKGSTFYFTIPLVIRRSKKVYDF